MPFGETLQLYNELQAWFNFKGYTYYWPPGQTDFNPGMDQMADKILSYGCYCQLRNSERFENLKEGIVPGTKLFFYVTIYLIIL